MGKRNRNETTAPAGAPEWVLTYGDMMSLLLCFFIMLTALSTIKDETRVKAMIESLRETFGAFVPKAKVEADYKDFASMIERIQDEIKRENKDRKDTGKATKKESQMGKFTAVRNIRDGLMITVGGLLLFQEGKADLLPESHGDLANVAKIIKGYRTKVLIRGHTSRRPLPPDSPFPDHMALSCARARAVLDFLVAEGVSTDRLNVEGCAGNEPLKTFVYDDEDAQANNRRVEIIVKDQMVEEFEGDRLGKK